MTPEQKLALLKRHCAELAEHFDAIQIVACELRPDGNTETFNQGSGLWHARESMAREFCFRDRADVQANSIAKKLNPPDEYPQSFE